MRYTLMLILHLYSGGTEQVPLITGIESKFVCLVVGAQLAVASATVLVVESEVRSIKVKCVPEVEA